ncbi:hypothetical protein WI88_32720 [Burkholderia ubonensis]|nr:hypothetical protein WI88_32720 [Burkholderia ubonensis]
MTAGFQAFDVFGNLSCDWTTRIAKIQGGQYTNGANTGAIQIPNKPFWDAIPYFYLAPGGTAEWESIPEAWLDGDVVRWDYHDPGNTRHHTNCEIYMGWV